MAKGITVFGDEFRKIREEKFYTQEAFGRELGMVS